MKNLTIFKFGPTTPRMLQHVTTRLSRMAKRAQHVATNDVVKCFVELHGRISRSEIHQGTGASFKILTNR